VVAATGVLGEYLSTTRPFLALLSDRRARPSTRTVTT